MAAVTAPVPLRTRVYIDGYNLYYGCLKGTPYKWLDLQVLFEQHILPSCGLPGTRSELLPVSIKYFTATIIESAARATDSVSSQDLYHRALDRLHHGRIELIRGYYTQTKIKAKLVDPVDPAKWPRDCQEVLVWKLEEKQSDVNLALQAYHDAITEAVDQVVIVTNDTDIAPALKLIRAHTQVTIGLVVPARQHVRQPNTELQDLAHWTRAHIRPEELAASQMPRVIPGPRKATIKPESWYTRPDLLQRVLALAIPVVGTRSKAYKWLQEANPYLSNQVPLDLLETDAGAALVVQYIEDYVARQATDKTQ
jgi:6-hydroxy-3-succinoylpyridine 3-monooxygenase